MLGLASTPALWFGFFAAMIGALSALQMPDASVPDGDPCCGYPDDWGDVALWLGGALVVGAGVLALGYLAGHALRFAAVGRPPAARTRRRLVRAAIVLAGALLASACGWALGAA